MRARELKAARARLGLSQQGLAEALDVYRETVARWETGATPITRVVALAVECLERRMAEHRKSA